MVTTLEHSPYHKTLRVTALIFAVVLVFQSGLFSSTTARLSMTTQSYLANAVGVYVGVPANDVNTLTSRITELELALDAKEREINVGLTAGSSVPSSVSTFILSGILFILLVLIVLNYALDFTRQRREAEEEQRTLVVAR